MKNGILVKMNRLWRDFEEIVLEVMVDEDVIMFASGWLCKYVMYSFFYLFACSYFCKHLQTLRRKGRTTPVLFWSNLYAM